MNCYDCKRINAEIKCDCVQRRFIGYCVREFEAEQAKLREQEILKMEKSNPDQKRADELAKKINDICKKYTDDEIVKNGVIIKTMMSKSKWYDNAGELNSRSEYVTYVHKDVAELVEELRAIRSQYQNKQFGFKFCEYRNVVVRYADHAN